MSMQPWEEELLDHLAENEKVKKRGDAKAAINGLLDSIKEDLEQYNGLSLLPNGRVVDLFQPLDDIEKIRALLDEA
jgi:hypothetical protein